MNMKKVVGILCTLAMVCVLLSGCSGSSDSSTASSSETSAGSSTESSGETSSEASSSEASSESSSETSSDASSAPADASKIADGLTLQVAIPVNPKVEDITTNQLTLYIEDTTGIQLDIIELSAEDTATQINSIMNGGDLPDMFLGYDFAYDTLCSYADAGLLAPLEDYVDTYGVNLKGTILADENLSNALAYATYDGHLYAVPSGGGLVTNVYATYQSYLQMHFVEEQGIEVPKTLDDFKTFLENVHSAHPDVVPWTTYADNNYIFGNISQAFQFTDLNTYLKVNNGTVECIANNELFKEALVYMKEMVDEGLIDPACFTQDKEVLATFLAQDGDNIGAIGCGNMCTNIMDSAGDEYKNLHLVSYLEGPHGYKSTQVNKSAARVRHSMVITSACEHTEEAFRLCDFFLSDDFAIKARVGFEGEQWEKASEGMIGRDGEQAWFTLLTTQEWVQPSTNVIWDNESFIHSNIMNHCEAASGVTSYPVATSIVEDGLVDLDSGEGLPTLLMSAEDSTEYGELQSLIVTGINTNIAQFVLGNRSLDEFETFCAELDDMGLARYIELAQAGYDTISQ